MTTPIDRTDLQALIRYHNDVISANRWLMSQEAVTRLVQTIQALEHYRDLCDTIDCRLPDAAPLELEPTLPPNEAVPAQEQAA